MNQVFKRWARCARVLALGAAVATLATSGGKASAALVNEAGNVASTAVVSADDPTHATLGLTNAVDGQVSEALPGSGGFDETLHTVFDGFGSNATNEILLSFATPVNLTELGAYVSVGDDVGLTSSFSDADRQVVQIQFLVNTGSGLVSAGTVVGMDTDNIGGFDRVGFSGSWSNVTQVQLVFTPRTAQSVRVGEVFTNGVIAVPEPASTGAIGLGMMLASLRRRRRA